jgi:hypothetical protein
MTGLDLMDAGYALGNYRFYDTMNETWRLATYLANVVGMVVSHLPFGASWIGMNVYTGLFVGLLACTSYLFFVNHQPKEDKKEFLLFIAQIGALSCCWAPTVVLYHYLGYIFMSLAVMLLYNAIVKDNMRYYIAAGVVLGLCVAVRMPNVTYMALIIPVWYYLATNNKSNKSWFGVLVQKTSYCVGGYLAGLLIPIVYIEARYGLSSYPNMVSSLFGMTDTATDYKPSSMLGAIFGDYISYSVWLLVFAAYIAAGIIMFKILDRIISIGSNQNKITYVFKIIYSLGFLVVLRFCYGRGMFGIDFADYFSMYKWMTVYLLLVIILCIWGIISKRCDTKLKLWSVFLLVIIFITPLGSNNGLYPIINNLFIVAPVSVLLLEEWFLKTLDLLKPNTAYVVKTIITYVILCTFLSALLFGINFVFHDYKSDTLRRVSVSLKCDGAANKIMTTAYKKENLEALDNYLYENSLNKKTLITYGDVPALSYIFNMKPAIYTTWADLDSNSLPMLCDDLAGIENGALEDFPVVIFGKEALDDTEVNSRSDFANKKLSVLLDFIEKNNYALVYENNAYSVYCIN